MTESSTSDDPLSDDDLVRLADDLFVEIDRHGMNGYWNWMIHVLCWDGALPLVVFSIPQFTKLFFAGRQGLIELTAIVVPIAAFLVRGAHGFKRYRNGEQRPWQSALFVAAILILALVDTVFILFESIPNVAQDSDWYIVVVLYLIYFVLMAIALLPVRVPYSEPPPHLGIDQLP